MMFLTHYLWSQLNTIFLKTRNCSLAFFQVPTATSASSTFRSAKRVCRRFSEVLSGTPSFNLHGDAHIEQYAVTDLGRGLTDFDDSSTGPAVIDLMRFGVSLDLTNRAHGWHDGAGELFDRFITGYRDALKDFNRRSASMD